MRKLIVLLITGQSGSGKGTFIEFFLLLCAARGIRVRVDGLGDRLRALVALPDNEWPEALKLYAAELREIAKTGGKQPYYIIETLLKQILDDANTDDIEVLIVDGTLRDHLECEFWGNLTTTETYKIQAVITDAPEQDCFDRLVKRTAKDKRPELSRVITHPDGTEEVVPDEDNIRKKLSWFKKPEILEQIRKNNLPVFESMNDGLLIVVEENACDVFEAVGLHTRKLVT